MEGAIMTAGAKVRIVGIGGDSLTVARAEEPA